MSLDNVKHIILVLSGKGGVGKSSITTQLALSLSLAGHSVGILDIDLTGPSIPRLLGVEDAKITQAPGGWLPVEVHSTQSLFNNHQYPPPPNSSLDPASTQGGSNNRRGSLNGVYSTANSGEEKSQIGSLHVMSLGFLLPSRSSAVVWRGPKKTAMVRQFLTSVLWPPGLSYLLVDTPPGTSDEHISLAETLLSSVASSSSHQQLAGAVIVTTPQAVATSDVRKEINFCRKVGVRVLGAVENMSGYVCECCGVETNLFGKGGGEVMTHECGVRFLGRVPVDVQWGSLVEEGKRPRYGLKDGVDDFPRESAVDGGGDPKGGPIEYSNGDPNSTSALILENLSPSTSPTQNNDTESAAPSEILGQSSDDQNALLVDKYRSCVLCPVFEGITKTLVRVVDEGAG